MLNRVVRVEPLPNYRLRVEFDDGVKGTIDLSGELVGEVFEPLPDEAMFRQVTIDEYGAVCWPNGADLAPDAMHIELSAKTPTRSGGRLKPASAMRAGRGRAAE
ncbi:MAG TPA: DUF2442 domain-containing protein [Stellaceae bacterium]|nr:DUF2442 domain-containing protein [Stellaceae bacterium]